MLLRLCQEKMADYLCQELTMVRHTSVICRRADATSRYTEDGA
ncbi:MAG: hypothetical protein ACLS5Z_10110 [Clostridium fessum]